MIGPLTYLDVGVIAIAVLSGLLALYRGLDARTSGDPVLDHRRARSALFRLQPPQVCRRSRRADGATARRKRPHHPPRALSAR